jgi:hypothetical protein
MRTELLKHMRTLSDNSRADEMRRDRCGIVVGLVLAQADQLPEETDTSSEYLGAGHMTIKSPKPIFNRPL